MMSLSTAVISTSTESLYVVASSRTSRRSGKEEEAGCGEHKPIARPLIRDRLAVDTLSGLGTGTDDERICYGRAKYRTHQERVGQHVALAVHTDACEGWNT